MKKSRLTGLLFMCGALMCGLTSLYSSIRAANRARRLVPVTAAALQDTLPGQDVLLEARVSDRHAVISHGLVAYVHEWRAVDEEGDVGSWSEYDTLTPPLILEIPDGLVQVGNDDYGLEDARSIEEDGAFDEPSTTRYRGIAVGDAVVAVGVASAGPELPQIEADFVALGTRERYVARRRLGGTILCAFSIFVGAVGGVVLSWGQLRRLLPWQR